MSEVEVVRNKKWSIVYEKAIKEDGSLYFPERLDHEFLEEAQKNMGSILFANQYLNEIFPAEDAKFRQEWFQYYNTLPETKLYTFAHIDPAISKKETSDFTGIAIVSVDKDMNWWVRRALRLKLTPSEIVDLCFEIQQTYKTNGIGIEIQAFQESLEHYLKIEMKKRQMVLPVIGIRRGTSDSKTMRIQGLIPYYKWGFIHHTTGCNDYERELLQFPRSAHDDISDAMSSLTEIVFYPTEERIIHEPNPNSTEYEKQVIQDLARRANERLSDGY